MGFDFTVIVPLLPSHCGLSSVFGYGLSFLLSSSVLLLMIVQQPAVILVFSPEGVRAHPSTQPSWFFLVPGFLKPSFYMDCKLLVQCILICFESTLQWESAESSGSSLPLTFSLPPYNPCPHPSSHSALLLCGGPRA